MWAMLYSLLMGIRRQAQFAAASSPTADVDRRVQGYVAAVVLFAVGLSAAVVIAGRPGLERPWLLVVIAALVALENVLAVRLRRREHGETVANDEALIVLAALLLSPVAALVAFAIGVAVGQLAQRRVLLKTVFNIGQLVGSAALAFLIVSAVAPEGAGDQQRVLAALVGVLAFSIANRVAVAGVLALVGASSIGSSLREDLGAVSLVWTGTVAAGLLAGLAGSAHPWALPFALVAMVALSVAFSGHARARQERQTRQEVVRSAAAGVFSIDDRGRVQTWNPEMERITERSARESIGSPLVDVFGWSGDDAARGREVFLPAAQWAPGERQSVKLQAGSQERWLTVSRADLPDGRVAFVAQDVTEQHKAEGALRDSEQQLRLALDAGYMGHWDWDLASGEVRWSENLERLCGLVPGSFGGTYEDFLAVIHPDDRGPVDDAADVALATGQQECVYRITRPDGSIRWLEDKGRVVHDADGRPRGMSGVAFDVTGRMQAAAMSALQRGVLEKVAEGAPLAVILDRLVELVEQQAEGAFAAVQLLDKEGQHLHHAAGASIPTSYAAAIDGIAVGPEAGSCGTAAFRRERVIVSDIATDPLWRDFRAVALADGLQACWSTPLFGADDELLGTFAIYHREPRAPIAADLELVETAGHLAGVAIARARQEERLVSAEEKYRRLVEQLPHAIYAFTPDLDGDERRAIPNYVSPQVEAMLGYTPEEWFEDPNRYSDIVHPEDRERVLDEIRRARNSGDRFRLEYRMVAKDDRVVWVHDETNYLRDDDGERVGIEGFLLDISDQKALESSLMQAQKMDAVGRLAGGIAHDFNNLMTGVIGFGGLVLSRLPVDDPSYAQVEQIVRAGERATALTSQLLAFSRKQILQLRVLDLNAVVADADTLLKRLIGEDVALTCVLAPDLHPVLADSTQLEQVIVNLAVNARDAMPTGGKLTIETTNVELDVDYAASHYEAEPGGYVLIAVTDTGIGMDAETQTRIFEPFFTTKGDGRGSGLGLATVFGIVEQNGGRVSVYSEPGKGTTFKILLPQAEHEATPSVLPKPAQGDPARGGAETVLLVEDEQLVRDLERELLEGFGYHVLESGDPREAIEIAAAYHGPIHLLLTDVVMPGIGGRELVERLAPTRPEMRVLYSSGYADDAIIRHGVLEAEVAFLTKPFALSALADKVREVLDAEQQRLDGPASAAPEDDRSETSSLDRLAPVGNNEIEAFS
jgi:PAS domain S-box-containing protein